MINTAIVVGPRKGAVRRADQGLLLLGWHPGVGPFVGPPKGARTNHPSKVKKPKVKLRSSLGEAGQRRPWLKPSFIFSKIRLGHFLQ